MTEMPKAPSGTDLCEKLLKELLSMLPEGASRKCLEPWGPAQKTDQKAELPEDSIKRCLQIAIECKDQAGQAVASLYLAMAYAHRGQFVNAIEASMRAKRICRSLAESDHWQRYSESLVTCGLGLIHQRQCDLSSFDSETDPAHEDRAKAISYYREALNLLEEAQRDYAAAGNQEQVKDIQNMYTMIRKRVDELESFAG